MDDSKSDIDDCISTWLEENSQVVRIQACLLSVVDLIADGSVVENSFLDTVYVERADGFWQSRKNGSVNKNQVRIGVDLSGSQN